MELKTTLLAYIQSAISTESVKTSPSLSTTPFQASTQQIILLMHHLTVYSLKIKLVSLHLTPALPLSKIHANLMIGNKLKNHIEIDLTGGQLRDPLTLTCEVSDRQISQAEQAEIRLIQSDTERPQIIGFVLIPFPQFENAQLRTFPIDHCSDPNAQLETFLFLLPKKVLSLESEIDFNDSFQELQVWSRFETSLAKINNKEKEKQCIEEIQQIELSRQSKFLDLSRSRGETENCNVESLMTLNSLLNEQNTKLQAQNQQLHSKIQSLQACINNLQTQQFKPSIEQLQQQLLSKNQQINTKQLQLAQLRQQNTALKTTIESMQATNPKRQLDFESILQQLNRYTTTSKKSKPRPTPTEIKKTELPTMKMISPNTPNFLTNRTTTKHIEHKKQTNPTHSKTKIRSAQTFDSLPEQTLAPQSPF